MKSQTTRALSDPHEKFLEEVYPGGRRSKSSGASYHDPPDVTTDDHVIEAKATEKKSISIKLEDWDGIRKKATNGRTPRLAIRFKDPYTNKITDLVLMEVSEDLERYADG